jgi:hypothetical protein
MVLDGRVNTRVRVPLSLTSSPIRRPVIGPAGKLPDRTGDNDRAQHRLGDYSDYIGVVVAVSAYGDRCSMMGADLLVDTT